MIGPEDSQGHRQITYVLKNHDVSIEDISRLRVEMVEAPGIEPGSARVPRKGATYLVTVFS